MIGILGWLVLVLGVGLLVFPEQIPAIGHMFSGYWLRLAGGVFVLTGGFFAWVGRA